MWDQRFSETGFAYGQAPNEFLLAQYQRIPAGGNVLCLAEGEGRNAVFLAQKGYCVTAVDISPVGLEKAQALARAHHVEIKTVVADLSEFDFGLNQYDGIISIFAHVPLSIRQRVHVGVKSALKAHGVFILEAYTPKQLSTDGVGGPPASALDMFMSSDSLAKELDGMNVNMNVECACVLNEGAYHTGNSEVVQFIATKPD